MRGEVLLVKRRGDKGSATYRKSVFYYSSHFDKYWFIWYILFIVNYICILFSYLPYRLTQMSLQKLRYDMMILVLQVCLSVFFLLRDLLWRFNAISLLRKTIKICKYYSQTLFRNNFQNIIPIISNDKARVLCIRI